jgi:hypothetical protein
VVRGLNLACGCFLFAPPKCSKQQQQQNIIFSLIFIVGHTTVKTPENRLQEIWFVSLCVYHSKISQAYSYNETNDLRFIFCATFILNLMLINWVCIHGNEKPMDIAVLSASAAIQELVWGTFVFFCLFLFWGVAPCIPLFQSCCVDCFVWGE